MSSSPHPNFFLLYVDRPPASADFYAGLLGRPAVEVSATFALFALESGVMLGLWSKHTVEPAATAGGGGAEVAFSLADRDAVDARYADWRAKGLPMLQAPVALDFGYTFVALDPDGHRLRVFAAGA
ncbi:VOC family protein [Janthinobacterium fluminis]|uniref:VOC family protein n=1 Tax=Janthinobacterium fluminis TaxID=2987524 RepID=A0ABT5K7M4_9BURK|nr:VOC family protein [Janthinobacterium fluminis]MDC8760423.1 VOC family protein [Janthinobacterium fluminis]